MVLARDTFIDALTALGELLPMGKSLSPQAVALAWGLLPLPAKELLDAEHLLYAMQQLQFDPEPARELSVSVQLLRYLFPLDNGRPVVERGLRIDLPQRMARPAHFHPLNAMAPELRLFSSDRLLQAGDDTMAPLRALVVPLCQRTAGVLEAPGTPVSEHLQQRSWLLGDLTTLAMYFAAGSLIGRWPLEVFQREDGVNLAQEWIRCHPLRWAAMRELAAHHGQRGVQASSRSTDREPATTASADLEQACRAEG